MATSLELVYISIILEQMIRSHPSCLKGHSIQPVGRRSANFYQIGKTYLSDLVTAEPLCCYFLKKYRHKFFIITLVRPNQCNPTNYIHTLSLSRIYEAEEAKEPLGCIQGVSSILDGRTLKTSTLKSGVVSVNGCIPTSVVVRHVSFRK